MMKISSAVPGAGDREQTRLLLFDPGSSGNRAALSGLLELLQTPSGGDGYEVTVASASPGKIAQRHGVHTIPCDTATLLGALAGHDAAVLFGLRLLDTREVAAGGPLEQGLRFLHLAARQSRPVVALLAGGCRVETERGKALLRDLLPLAGSVAVVGTGLEQSLRAFGVSASIHVTGDPERLWRRDHEGELSQEATTLLDLLDPRGRKPTRPASSPESPSDQTKAFLAQTNADLAENLSARGRFAEAAAEYQRAVDLGMRQACVLNNLGNALARSGDYERAKRVLTEALELDPDATEAAENLKRLNTYLQHNQTPAADLQAGAGRRGALSLCMIAKNEEKHLPECLKALSPCVDEMIVVDTGSEDATVAIAKAMGAKVHHFQWVDDFAAARNESLRHATGDWVLWMDADDRIEPADLTRIHELLGQPRDRAFFFTLRSGYEGEATTLVKQIRLAPNLPGLHFSSRIHETLHASIRELRLGMFDTDITVTHVGYAIDEEAMNRKMRRNRRLLQMEAEANPKDFRVWYYLAGTSSALGEDDKCIDICNRMLADPDCDGWMRGAALGMLADYDVKHGQYEPAAARLQEARELLPRHPQMALQLAQCYYQLDRHDDARALLNEVVSSSVEVTEFPILPESLYSISHYYLGLCAEDDDQPHEALAEYEKALAHRERFFECLLRAGSLLLRLDRWQPAEQALRKAVAIQPRAAVGWCDLGNALAAQRQLEAAEEAYRKAMDLQPDYTDATLNLASLLGQLCRFNEAEAACRTVLAREPHCAAAHHALGCIHYALGRFDNAVACHLRAVEGGMTAPVVYHALGRALREAGRVDESVQVFRAVLSVDQAPVEAWVDLAEAHLKAGRSDRARQCCSQYLALRPDDPTATGRLGHLYHKLGREDLAEQADRLAAGAAVQGSGPGVSRPALQEDQ